MSKYEIPYINMIIRLFGERYGMTRRQAYAYLSEHRGLDFLISYYDVEHLQSVDETLDNLVLKCRNNGGQIV